MKRIPWQWGELFFAQHLLDYDKASNVLSWQWSAGTGVDQHYKRLSKTYGIAQTSSRNCYRIF